MCVSHTYDAGMTTRVETKFRIDSWDEQPYRKLDDTRKFARAEVRLSSADQDVEASATWEMLLYYPTDGISSYTGLLHLSGRLGERTGEVVLQVTGEFDGTRARCDLTVVPGSGTGGLAGIRGSGVSVSTHADYPFMPVTLDYEV